MRGAEEDDDDEEADEEHPLNRLATGAVEKGQELLSKVGVAVRCCCGWDGACSAVGGMRRDGWGKGVQ